MPYVLVTGDDAVLDPYCLALVEYVPGDGDDPRLIRPGLRHLGGPRREAWRSEVPVRQATHAGITISHNGSVAMGQLHIDEAAMREAPADATEAAYRRLFSALEAAGYPQLQRTWVYIGDIHRGEGDTERYRQFCVGRGRVYGAGTEQGRFPAATVIGRDAPGVLIYFIAAREAGRPVENPRQVSAYRYPSQYGPQSPSFARAMHAPWDQLLLSGTAAIVGHTTLHPHDAGAQLVEMARNVEALLGEAGGEWKPLRAKLYLRPGATLPQDAAERLPLAEGATLLEGTVCRPDLVVEVEALFGR